MILHSRTVGVLKGMDNGHELASEQSLSQLAHMAMHVWLPDMVPAVQYLLVHNMLQWLSCSI